MSDDSANEIDLTSLKDEQFLTGIGDLVIQLVGSYRAALVVRREDGVLTFLDVALIKQIPPEKMAEVLLESWDDAQVEEFLGYVYE